MMLKLSKHSFFCLVFNFLTYCLELNGTVFTSLKNMHGDGEAGYHLSLVYTTAHRWTSDQKR